jgi:hypothetical protein
MVEHSRQTLELMPLAQVAQRPCARGRIRTAEFRERRQHRTGLRDPGTGDHLAPACMPRDGRRLEAVTIVIEEAQADEQAMLE